MSIEYYNAYQNIVNTMLRNAKESYFKHMLDDANDNTRKAWRLLNDLVNSGRSK